MTTTSAEKKKDISLELIRIFTAFFIIFHHTGTEGFILFSRYEVGSLQYWLYRPWFAFCCFDVPMFFTISGITLLKKQEPLKVLFRKRILRSFIVLVLVSVIYYVKDVLSFPQISFMDIVITFFKNFFCGAISGHLHFMYKYLVFLIALPFLRKIAQNISRQELHYMLIVAFAVQFFAPMFAKLLSDGGSLQSDVSYLNIIFITYPFLGYYLYYVFDFSKIKTKHIIGMVLCSVVLLFLSCFPHKYFPPQESFTWVYVATVFIVIKYYFSNIKNTFAQKIILSFGKCTFSVYLFHMLVMHSSWGETIENFLISHISPLTAILLFCLLTLIVSVLITLVLKKIPLLDKLL